MENIQVLIIGGGIAGISAAIWCERLGLQSVIVERESKLGGQINQIHNEIWDFPPGIYRNGAALAGELLQHKTVNRLDCRLNEQVLSVDPETHIVRTEKAEYRVEYLILASGSQPNQIRELSGSSRLLAPWFSTTAQADLFHGKDVLVIGGGDRAVESVYNIAPFARHVYLAVRSGRFRARAEWVKRLNHCANVTVYLHTYVTGEQQEADRSIVTLRTSTDRRTFSLSVDWILPRIGVKGNSLQLPGVAIHDADFIRVNSYQTTTVEWIYAIGDVANGAAYASLSLASGQAMRAVKHISLQVKEHEDA